MVLAILSVTAEIPPAETDRYREAPPLSKAGLKKKNVLALPRISLNLHNPIHLLRKRARPKMSTMSGPVDLGPSFTVGTLRLINRQ